MAYIRHVTLSAGVVTTWTLSDNSSGFEIMNRNGAGEIYVNHTGQNAAGTPDPTVGGNDFDVIPAATGASAQFRRIGTNSIVVKVISAAATTVSFRSLA